MEESKQFGPSQHSGVAGQYAVMAELAARGYNVALPIIDTGSDILAITKETGKIDRIQVKTAGITRGKSDEKRLWYYFQVWEPRISRHLAQSGSEPYFIFAMMIPGFPVTFTYVILPRQTLQHLVQEHHLGVKSRNKGIDNIYFNIVIRRADNSVGFFHNREFVSLAPYIDNWKQWPPLARSRPDTSPGA